MASTMENTTASIMVSTMEANRKWVILSIAIAALLIGAVVYTAINTDHEGPVINVPADDVLYKEGDDTSALLTSVTAIDEQEGDVTETLIIENVIPLSDDTQAKVIYAAKDSHNNITKTDRIIQYEPLPEPVAATGTTDPAAREAAIRVAALIAEKTKQAAALPEDRTETAEEEAEEQNNNTGLNDIVAGAAVVTESRQQEEKPEDEPEPEPAAEPVPESEPVVQPEADGPADPTPTQDAPKVTLTTKSISMYQGDAFNPYAFIASATDSGVDVTHLVKTSGSVDVSKAGSYTVSYFAVDADGHKSNTATLAVQVIPRP